MYDELVDYFNEFRQHFRLVDAVDIFLIAVLAYAVLVWFKHTASRGVVVGVSLLAALYFVARALDMYLTSLAFHTALAFLLVGFVIVFQEEIRRAFERVAKWGTFRGLRARSTVSKLEVATLAEAVFAMAEQRTGAILVLAGHEPLERHVDGGIELGGRITKPILYSIFDASSPGHDGAVLIVRDRIERFGVHLPISKNHDEICGRGTRHSAALGLSECSDALAVVVSEERGAVSTAEDGKLTETKTAADLKRSIESFLDNRFPREHEATWKRFITHELGLKFVALFLAVCAWFILAFDLEKVQTSVVVPIEYRNAPEHLEFSDSTPADALVTLSGSERAFRLLDRRELRISVNLSRTAQGIETVTITPKDVRLPTNLRVDRIQPSTIHVQLKADSTEANTAAGKN